MNNERSEGRAATGVGPLTGRRALVTGGSRGIGAAIVGRTRNEPGR